VYDVSRAVLGFRNQEMVDLVNSLVKAENSGIAATSRVGSGGPKGRRRPTRSCSDNDKLSGNVFRIGKV
jgi:hypothetical protein